MNTTEFPPYKGLAILVKAPGASRTFVPREGETITIKHGKELWTFKNPQGQANPGVIIYDVQLNHDHSQSARFRQLPAKFTDAFCKTG